jgi:hypothetical protein
MSRVADEEGTAFAEMFRHPVMDVIGRKPVHFPDIDFGNLRTESSNEGRAFANYEP